MSTDLTRQHEPVAHLRFEGNSWDVTCADLDVGDLSSDAHISQQFARHLDVPPSKLANYVVDRS